jgi:hypothetical protein
MVSTFSKRIKKARIEYEKKKYKRKAMVTKPAQSLAVAGPRPYPAYYRCKLTYATFLNLDPTISTTGTTWYFSANSLFDPDVSGTGHQPLGFDQLAAVYNKYRVLKSHIECIFAATGNQSTGCAQASIRTTRGTSLQTNWETIREQPNCRSTLITPAYNPKLIVGWNSKYLSKNQQDDLQAQTGSNPVNNEYFAVSVMWQGDPNVDPAVIRVQVKIVYDAMFTELEELGGS